MSQAGIQSTGCRENQQEPSPADGTEENIGNSDNCLLQFLKDNSVITSVFPTRVSLKIFILTSINMFTFDP
jgi:hypothetical protein